MGTGFSLFFHWENEIWSLEQGLGFEAPILLLAMGFGKVLGWEIGLGKCFML